MTVVRGKSQSLILIGVANVIAVGVGVLWLFWGPTTGRMWLNSLIADVLATVVIFVFSRLYRNSSFYDAYWSVIPPLLLIYWWSQSGVHAVRCWLIAMVVVVWAVRLTANWVYAFPGLHHEDWRYPMLRANAGRWGFLVDLVAIHLIPTLLVFAGMVPAYVTVTRPGSDVGWLTAIACVVGLAAAALELVADTQMHRFTRDRRPGEVMDRGLWSWSRHPNYFGEFIFWVSLALFGIAVSPADAWWLSLGAVGMLGMFLGFSIPMMEQRSLQRRPEYQVVIRRVPRFVPRPPRTSA
ncbi:steroid 5-alpha reductase family enzyme [Mycobacteroides chelonae]|nr:steroid 5-alpha reductase family enzyme [Mycobacteroides chelonae]